MFPIKDDRIWWDVVPEKVIIKRLRHGTRNGTLQASAERIVYVYHRMRLLNKGSVREELSDDSRLDRKGNDIRNCIKEGRWGSGQR